ncbi:MAG: ATP-binding cassette domain-containing protein [Acutalibacteraceae bacterium]
MLHDISLYAKPGQKIAFVGATGAGKTTITNLINRFYDIDDGKIRYDGININKIKKPDLRRSLGIVLQDTQPVHRHGHGQHPLRQAGRHGRGMHRRGEARQRATTSSRRLPDGYNTMLTGRRREPLAGPAPAARHRPRGRGRSAGHDPRRGDQLHRHPHGGARAARHGRA